jgi:glycosyltransferase involved in cell wall biosynthesis
MSAASSTGVDVLVIAPRVPAFDRASGWLRLYLLLQMMTRTQRVRFLGHVDPSDPESPRYVRALRDMGIEVHSSPEVDVVDIVDDVKGFVFFEFFAAAEHALPRVRLRRPDLPLVVDTVDVHFVREFRAVSYSRRPWYATARAHWIKRRELAVYARADLVITVTEDDRRTIRRELPQARVCVIPNIHTSSETVPLFHARQRDSLLFVGGFPHTPNVDAVLYFTREILPLVKQALPNVTFTIVGAAPPQEVQELARDNVIVRGWVPEIAPFLDSHCVSIAPLRFGSGIKGKIGEALAAGLPVVTTSVGAEGMSLEHGTTALIADSAPAFAEAVVQLCSDAALHQRLSECGRAHALATWGLASVSRQLAEVIDIVRGLPPKTLTRRQRIAARMLDRYVRSGWAGKVERVRSVLTWYGRQAHRRLRRR